MVVVQGMVEWMKIQSTTNIDIDDFKICMQQLQDPYFGLPVIVALLQP